MRERKKSDKMKKILIFTILSLLVFYSCDKPLKTSVPVKKAFMNVDTCLQGFIIIQYIGEQDKPVKSLLLRTNGNDTAYYQFIRGNKTIRNHSIRRFVLNELIISKYEFGVLKEYIKSSKIKKTNILTDDMLNPQQVKLIDKCDTIKYIVDKYDTNYFKNLIQLIKNDSLRRYLKYSAAIQESEK